MVRARRRGLKPRVAHEPAPSGVQQRGVCRVREAELNRARAELELSVSSGLKSESSTIYMPLLEWFPKGTFPPHFFGRRVLPSPRLREFSPAVDAHNDRHDVPAFRHSPLRGRKYFWRSVEFLYMVKTKKHPSVAGALSTKCLVEPIIYRGRYRRQP